MGEGELNNLGYFVKLYGKSALVIANKDDIKRVSKQLDYTMEKYGVSFVYADFHGECSKQEVARLKEIAKENKCATIIGLGGGKAIDTAKCVNAAKLRLIIVPTIAATDAPTSHSAVLYTEDGAFDDYAYFTSPDVVLIDTTVIAAAPVRFLVSGMGDALSTYFEARANQQSFANVNAGLPCGAREKKCDPAKQTLAAMALADLCYQTLLSDGLKAKLSCEAKVVTKALENIIETNILLSGLGFESGGLAAAHAIHDGLTVLEETHKMTHGEKVAFGTICQLILENAPDEEILTVINFCNQVGLPVCLKDLGVENIGDRIYQVAEKSCIKEESIHSMPFPVTPADVVAAILAADKMGKLVKYDAE